MIHEMGGGRNDSGSGPNDPGRTGKWTKRPVTGHKGLRALWAKHCPLFCRLPHADNNFNTSICDGNRVCRKSAPPVHFNFNFGFPLQR